MLVNSVCEVLTRDADPLAAAVRQLSVIHVCPFLHAVPPAVVQTYWSLTCHLPCLSGQTFISCERNVDERLSPLRFTFRYMRIRFCPATFRTGSAKGKGPRARGPFLMSSHY